MLGRRFLHGVKMAVKLAAAPSTWSDTIDPFLAVVPLLALLAGIIMGVRAF